MDISCSCADCQFHGWNLSRRRLLNKAALAPIVELKKLPDGYKAWTDPEDVHFVAIEDGEMTRLCKHTLAVLWAMGITPVLVEYADERRELRTEPFWLDKLAVRAIMRDGEVIAVTPLKEETNGIDEESHGPTGPAV